MNDTVVIFDRVRENLRKYSDIKIYELTNIKIALANDTDDLNKKYDDLKTQHEDLKIQFNDLKSQYEDFTIKHEQDLTALRTELVDLIVITFLK